MSLATFAGLFVPEYLSKQFIDASVVCDAKDPGYKGWEDGFLEDASPAYKDFYVYDVKNAAAFLTGAAKAEVQELGPWVFQCKSKNVAVEFEGATVEYNSYTMCEHAPDHELNKHKLPLSTPITHYNAAYSTILASAQNEGILLLNAEGCSTTQIGNIADLLTKGPCDWTTGAPVGEDCACCIPNSVDTTAMEAGTGGPVFNAATGTLAYFEGQPGNEAKDFRMCPDLASSTSAIATAISKFAYTDNGIPLSLSPLIVSPLMVKKTVQEMAFGYASALAGYFTAKTALGTTDVPGLGPVSNSILYQCTGEAKMAAIAEQKSTKDAVPTGECLMKKLGENALNSGETVRAGQAGLLQYAGVTKISTDVAAVCAAECSMDTGTPSCSGYANTDQTDDALKYLNGIGCSPLTTAYGVNMACFGDPASTCECGDGTMMRNAETGVWNDAPMCGCFASGSAANAGVPDVSGLGCLATVPGFLNAQNIYNDEQAEAYQPSGKAVTDPYGEPAAKTYKMNTGCDASGDIGDGVNELLEYTGLKESPTWVPPSAGKLLPTPADIGVFNYLVKNDAPNVVVGKVSGSNGGTQIKAKGLSTRKWASKTFNDGKAPVKEYPIFVSQVSTQVVLEPKGNVDLLGIDVTRYQPSEDLLRTSTEGNTAKGVGVVDGTFAATYTKGFAIAVSFPRFLFGAANLFTDINLTDQNDAAITKAGTDEKPDDYLVTLLVEKSTGATMSGHNRLMGSMYNYECNPGIDAACGLFPQEGATAAGVGCWLIPGAVPRNLGVGGYPCSAANVFTPNAPAEILVPTFWVDEHGEIPADSAAILVGIGEMLQLVDAGSIVFGFIGVVMIMFGVFGVWCSR